MYKYIIYTAIYKFYTVLQYIYQVLMERFSNAVHFKFLHN